MADLDAPGPPADEPAGAVPPRAPDWLWWAGWAAAAVGVYVAAVWLGRRLVKPCGCQDESVGAGEAVENAGPGTSTGQELAALAGDLGLLADDEHVVGPPVDPQSLVIVQG